MSVLVANILMSKSFCTLYYIRTQKNIHICACLYIYKYLCICGLLLEGQTKPLTVFTAGSRAVGLRIEQEVECVKYGETDELLSFYFSVVFDYVLYHHYMTFLK